jgi:hypothetical protein
VRLIWLTCICAWAQSGIEAPKLGWMLDRAGAVRPVIGVAAAVTAGDPVATGAISMGCSRFCLIKTALAIVSATGSVDAPEGPALFDGERIYFPQTGQLVRWHDDHLDWIDFHVSGEILSIRGDLFAVRHDDGVWIVREGDAVIDAISDATGPVMLLDRAVLYAAGDELVLRRADRSEVRFALAGVVGLSRLGAGYIQISTAGSIFAMRVDRQQIFQLPEPAQ